MAAKKDDPPPSNDEYDPSNDGPEAKLSREDQQAYDRRHDADSRIITQLLDSLTPYDAIRHIFTWAEQKKWFLKRRRDG